jgi:IS66 Orf2 like protein
MTLLPPGVKVHLALGYIDMRKGIDGLAMLVQSVLRQDPFSGHCSCSGAAPGPTSSRSCFGMGPGSVSSPNGLSMVSFCGHPASSPARRCR